MISKVSSLKLTSLARFIVPVLIAGLTLGLVLAMATEVSAAPPISWYVDPTSGSDATGCGTVIMPCLTIGYAIGEAESGASIILTPGTYTQTATLEITKSITLTARDGLGSAVVAGDGSIDRVILIESDDVTLSDLEMRNGTGDVIRQSGAYTRTVITGTIVHDCGDECIQLKKCTNCLIENVTVYDAAQDGLSIAEESRNSTIRNCEVYSTSSENAAIYIYDSYSMTVESTYLHDNQAANGIGFYKNYSGTHTIANNLIVHNEWQSGSHCYDEADGNAIWIYKPRDPSTYTVRHNTLDDNRPANVCAKPGNAIYVKKSADGVVVNVNDNIATNHEGYGIRTWDGASVNYSYNDFWQNASGVTDGNPVDGGGNISANPLYKDDYTLPDESPAANAASDGKDMGYLTVEHESASLPIGGATIPLGKVELLAPWVILAAALMRLTALLVVPPRSLHR